MMPTVVFDRHRATCAASEQPSNYFASFVRLIINIVYIFRDFSAGQGAVARTPSRRTGVGTLPSPADKEIDFSGLFVVVLPVLTLWSD
jgi:hypothetical protein